MYQKMDIYVDIMQSQKRKGDDCMLLANICAGLACSLIWAYRQEKHTEYMEALAILDELEVEMG